MIEDDISRAAVRVLDLCRAKGLKLATAESCTGGLVAGALTEIAGSSDVVECGFVVYSNAAKQTMLGVPAAVLERHGAVSRETAEAMAQGALEKSSADVAVAVTGIAGPPAPAAAAPRSRSGSCTSPRRRAAGGASIAKSVSAMPTAGRCGSCRSPKRWP